jgi:hypothetical protein
MSDSSNVYIIRIFNSDGGYVRQEWCYTKEYALEIKDRINRIEKDKKAKIYRLVEVE